MKDNLVIAIATLERCLAEVPFIQMRSQELPFIRGKEIDACFEVSFPFSRIYLIVEVKGNGQPRLAREAVKNIQRCTSEIPNSYGVLIAPYISPRSAEICLEAGVGYLDLAGNCRLSFGNVFILKEGKPNQIAEKRALRSLYYAKAERVLRVLLNDPNRQWRSIPLSETAAVSLGQVANVKKLLADREWLGFQPGGVTLTNPESLLLEWAANYHFDRHQARHYYLPRPPQEIESQLASVCREQRFKYALTGLSGAAHLGVITGDRQLMAYVEQTNQVASAIEMEERKSAAEANVSLLTAYDEGIFYGVRENEGFQIVSPVQLFLDLYSAGKASKDLAQRLLEIIRAQWHRAEPSSR